LGNKYLFSQNKQTTKQAKKQTSKQTNTQTDKQTDKEPIKQASKQIRGTELNCSIQSLCDRGSTFSNELSNVTQSIDHLQGFHGFFSSGFFLRFWGKKWRSFVVVKTKVPRG